MPDEMPLVEEDRLGWILGSWMEAGGPTREVATHLPPDDDPLERSRAPLAARRFTRDVDTEWRRTSYSGLSSAARPHADPSGRTLSEPEVEPEVTDALPLGADDDQSPEAPEDLALMDVASPMAELPFGATFGSLVHAVLEHADPHAADLDAELHQHVAEQRVWWPVDVERDVLVAALREVWASPLGALAAETTLGAIAVTDRLTELDFELPLSGGDDTSYAADQVRLGDLAPLLRRHLPEGDPVRGYAETLDADPDLAGQSLRGYLTGSIDVVLRVPVGGSARYLTVDYKTNWLGEPGAALTARDYRPQALADAMGHSDYPLQALLYTVVLHRFLRWRLPGYDPATHLGGVLYLYLRGMCGAKTPRVDGEPCGVFSWQPPVALVQELSDLLDGVSGGAS